MYTAWTFFLTIQKGCVCTEKKMKCSKILTVLLGIEGWWVIFIFFFIHFSTFQILCNEYLSSRNKCYFLKVNTNGKGGLNLRRVRAGPWGSPQTHTVSKIQDRTKLWHSRGTRDWGLALPWWVWIPQRLLRITECPFSGPPKSSPCPRSGINSECPRLWRSAVNV